MIWTRMLAASLFAVMAAAAPQSANAADLYGEKYRSQDDQDDDDAPRYGERRDYGSGDGYNGNGNGYSGNGYSGNGYNDDRYQGSTKDGYLPPLDRTPRFTENGGSGRNGCAPRWEVRNRLVSNGWRNFQRLAVRQNIVVLRAERPNGQAFDIKVDRCSGEIVAQRPAYNRGYGAYGPGPRRYGWAH